jgi:hypothetical protein
MNFSHLNSLVITGIGDWSSVLGLIIGIIGFIITIYTVIRAKSASEQASLAAQEARDQMRHIDTISEISLIIASLSEVKWLHRNNGWEVLQDRYSKIRCSLIVIKTSNKTLTDDHKKAIQGTIQIITQIEKKVEQAISENSIPTEIAQFNTAISKQIDKLQQILVEIKILIGRI